MFRPCVVIPVYNHEHAIGNVLAQVLAHGLPVILVDDGCSAACAAVLDHLVAAHPERVVLERHAVNQGKGGAVLTGFARATRDGYSHVLQVDADGQHSVADVPRFLDAARAAPRSVIAGCPLYDASVPALRLYARYLTHVWVWINTLSLSIRDSMCGFRVYPVAPVLALARRRRLGLRMNFDIEILVRLYWDGLAIVNLPTRVGYPQDGVSHFKAWTDNALISRLHMTLFFGMLPRIPSLLVRAWRS
ncbi:glycosyltransferase family 2 protein [Massilia luteola]|jgi:glycosyltransferase involved in cell wall biosynthesis|uniref:glycosyltransferase family 2 protein n=1 Tax=Massilia luteola TaxID=3081751 RepID=UPI002ACC3209|nr:glycosyltransferase family 2 protein [Massilia sp. Gc5]